MEEYDFQVIASKSIRGVFALISRTFFIQVLGIIANLILAAYLSTSAWGVFLIVSSLVSLFTYFQDIGLAASLIQKKEEPTVHELRTTFTVQLILISLLVVIGLLFSQQITHFYKLKAEGYYLFLALLTSLFISSLRTIPTVLLERHLDFHKLVWPQIIENLFYFSALIIFAVQGYGITTFTIAVLARSIAGLITTYIIQSWDIGISFDKNTFKKLVSFGLPFQTNSILALVKDDLFNLYVGKILPLTQVGYVGFSQKWAYMPLRLVMDNVIKITFPTFSRLQHDTQALKKAIEKSLFFIAFCMFPAAVVIIFYSPMLVTMIPKYAKWQPALLSLVFFSLGTILSSLSTPLTNFLNAIGKVKITLYLMVFWTAATWIMTPILIMLYGFNGVAAGSFIISFSSIFVFLLTRKYVPYSIIQPTYKQFISSIILAVFIYFTQFLITSLPLLFIHLCVSGIVYVGLITLIAKQEIQSTVSFVLKSIKK